MPWLPRHGDCGAPQPPSQHRHHLHPSPPSHHHDTLSLWPITMPNPHGLRVPRLPVNPGAKRSCLLRDVTEWPAKQNESECRGGGRAGGRAGGGRRGRGPRACVSSEVGPSPKQRLASAGPLPFGPSPGSRSCKTSGLDQPGPVNSAHQPARVPALCCPSAVQAAAMSEGDAILLQTNYRVPACDRQPFNPRNGVV